MEDHIPHINIDPESLVKTDSELILSKEYDHFYRRIVEFILGKIEETIDHEMLAVLQYEDKEYQLSLPVEGYKKSLNKALEYFIKIEEYETCDLIKQIEKEL